MCSCCLPRPRRCTVVVRFLARFLAWLRAAARARTQKSGRRAASAAFLNGKSRADHVPAAILLYYRSKRPSNRAPHTSRKIPSLLPLQKTGGQKTDENMLCSPTFTMPCTIYYPLEARGGKAGSRETKLSNFGDFGSLVRRTRMLRYQQAK